tara:strand:- start:628 stop:1089 length:462 start_codon:yes stop_codon:yes gene_type:complete
MSIDEQDISVRVINEEYDRVLSNPDNLIMSEDLQELMDMPIQPPDEPRLSVDTMSITIIDEDGLGVSVRGSFSRLACIESGVYEVEVESENVRQEFISTLEVYRHSAGSAPLLLSGTYESEIESIEVMSWAVEQSGPHTSKLKIAFRSEDVIL